MAAKAKSPVASALGVAFRNFGLETSRVLKIGFRITADGGADAVVDQVSIVEDAGMGNVAFEGCVLSVMQDLRFDPPEKGSLTVKYPIVFSNDGGQG